MNGPIHFAQTRTCRLAFVVVTVTSCAGANWQPVAVDQPRSLDPRTILEFHFTPDSLVRLHGVQLTRDSVTGIPWLDHLSCTTCRVSYQLDHISQPRTGDPGAGAWNILVPFVVIVGGLYALASAIRSADY